MVEKQTWMGQCNGKKQNQEERMKSKDVHATEEDDTLVQREKELPLSSQDKRSDLSVFNVRGKPFHSKLRRHQQLTHSLFFIVLCFESLTT